LGRPSHPGHAPKYGEQGQVRERVRQLGAITGLEVRQQVELAAVVGAVTTPAEWHDAGGVVAAAK